MQLGIDVGGSLTKVVLVDERDNQYFTFEPQQDEGLDQLLEQYPNTPICATGCGAPLLQAKYPDRVTITDELVSFCTGSRYYAGQLAWKQPYILTSLGTAHPFSWSLMREVIELPAQRWAAEPSLVWPPYSLEPGILPKLWRWPGGRPAPGGLDGVRLVSRRAGFAGTKLPDRG